VLLVDLLIHKEVVSVTAKLITSRKKKWAGGGGKREFPRWWEATGEVGKRRINGAKSRMFLWKSVLKNFTMFS